MTAVSFPVKLTVQTETDPRMQASAQVGFVLQAGPQLRRFDVGAVAGLLRPRSLRRGTIFGAIGRYMSWLRRSLYTPYCGLFFLRRRLLVLRHD